MSNKEFWSHLRTQPSAQAEPRRSMSGATEQRSPVIATQERSATWHREAAAQAHLAASTAADDFPEIREIASSKTPCRRPRLVGAMTGWSKLHRTQPSAHAEPRRSMNVSHRTAKHPNLNSPPPKNRSASPPSLLPPAPHVR